MARDGSPADWTWTSREFDSLDWGRSSWQLSPLWGQLQAALALQSGPLRT